MSDYPKNKLTGRLDRKFFGNSRDYYNLIMNRLFDTNEIANADPEEEKTAFILDGIDNNSNNQSKKSQKTLAIVNIEGQKYVELMIRFHGNRRNPSDILMDPTIETNPVVALDLAQRHPKAYIDLNLYLENNCSYRTFIKVIKANGDYYVTKILPSLQQIKQKGLDVKNPDFADADFLFGKGVPTTQNPIKLNKNKPGNKKKIDGTVFPMPIGKGCSSILGVRPRPPTDKDKAKGTTGKLSWHAGIDVAGPTGDPIYTILNGTVDYIKKTETGGGGKQITIDHGRVKRIDGTEVRMWTVYMHCSGFPSDLKRGKQVVTGDQIAFCGMTGQDKDGKSTSTGPHLHLEVRFGNKQYSDFSNRADPLWLFGWVDHGMKIFKGKRNNPKLWKSRVQDKISKDANWDGKMPKPPDLKKVKDW